MRTRANERQQMADICREELDQASRRIGERLAEYESDPDVGDGSEGARRFYEDLFDKDWTEADEELFNSLDDKNEKGIKQIMREAFRRSRIHPVPSFEYVINSMKKPESGFRPEATSPLANPDAISAGERERVANLLEKELAEVAIEIASKLQLSQADAEIVREELELVSAHIIGNFTPLT